jgi:dsRNA-specific ribonuclease
MSLDQRVKDAKSTDNYPGQCTKMCSDKGFKHQPIYETDAGEGPSHERTFTCLARLPDYPLRVSQKGASKKEAKARAACVLLQEMEKLPEVVGERKVDKDIKRAVEALVTAVEFGEIREQERG